MLKRIKYIYKLNDTIEDTILAITILLLNVMVTMLLVSGAIFVIGMFISWLAWLGI